MAEARLQADWVRETALACLIVNRNGMQKQALDPLKILPPQFRPPPPRPRKKSPEEAAEENRLGWVVLDRYFGGK